MGLAHGSMGSPQYCFVGSHIPCSSMVRGVRPRPGMSVRQAVISPDTYGWPAYCHILFGITVMISPGTPSKKLAGLKVRPRSVPTMRQETAFPLTARATRSAFLPTTRSSFFAFGFFRDGTFG